MKVIREVCVAGAVIDWSIRPTHHQLGTRTPKSKPTREAVIKNNERIAEKRLARILNANFYPGDWHVTLTYAAVPSPAEAKKMLDNFLRRMRREYRKLGKEMKFVAVTEYENHRIHHHIVMNYINGGTIASQWQEGRVRFTGLDKTRNYTALANYLIKETRKTFRKADNMTKCRYRCSRNMAKPIVVKQEVHVGKAWDEPKAIKGYTLVEESIRRFENPCTHFPCLEYVMVANDPVPRIKKWRKGTAVKKQETYQRAEAIKQVEMQDYIDWRTI